MLSPVGRSAWNGMANRICTLKTVQSFTQRHKLSGNGTAVLSFIALFCGILRSINCESFFPPNNYSNERYFICRSITHWNWMYLDWQKRQESIYWYEILDLSTSYHHEISLLCVLNDITDDCTIWLASVEQQWLAESSQETILPKILDNAFMLAEGSWYQENFLVGRKQNIWFQLSVQVIHTLHNYSTAENHIQHSISIRMNMLLKR